MERLGGALMGWVEKGKRRIRACQGFWVAYCLNSLPLGPTENFALNFAAAAVVLKFSMLLLLKKYCLEYLNDMVVRAGGT